MNKDPDYYKKYYAKHKDRLLAYQRAQRKNETPERRKARLARKQNPVTVHNCQLKRKFGITVEQFNEMLTAQNGVCAICGTAEIEQRTGRRLSVDHCHASGRIRALLCIRCNPGLGSFKDSPELLRAAADYIEAHKK
jgi:hypothetical protein